MVWNVHTLFVNKLIWIAVQFVYSDAVNVEKHVNFQADLCTSGLLLETALLDIQLFC